MEQENDENEDEKVRSHIRYNESGQSNFLFYSFIGISLACYLISLTKLFRFVYENCLFYSCWITLGSAAGFMAIVQFEGSQSFFTRLFKKSTLPVILCLVISMVGCLFEGFQGHCYISVFYSMFQCLCLAILTSLYVSTPITFFLSIFRSEQLWIDELSTQKAKE